MYPFAFRPFLACYARSSRVIYSLEMVQFPAPVKFSGHGAFLFTRFMVPTAVLIGYDGRLLSYGFVLFINAIDVLSP